VNLSSEKNVLVSFAGGIRAYQKGFSHCNQNVCEYSRCNEQQRNAKPERIEPKPSVPKVYHTYQPNPKRGFGAAKDNGFR
jgi:hypothetical protein